MKKKFVAVSLVNKPQPTSTQTKLKDAQLVENLQAKVDAPLPVSKPLPSQDLPSKSADPNDVNAWSSFF